MWERGLLAARRDGSRVGKAPFNPNDVLISRNRSALPPNGSAAAAELFPNPHAWSTSRVSPLGQFWQWRCYFDSAWLSLCFLAGDLFKLYACSEPHDASFIKKPTSRGRTCGPRVLHGTLALRVRRHYSFTATLNTTTHERVGPTGPTPRRELFGNTIPCRGFYPEI